ncbi:proprotein convertase subtilisin/kexin type 5-like isoform X1 [Mizuhopecten yessoensis]|uniref:Proprotein convertase subtilisin/kexin type 5 n=1 Tax=Mizuhopecten yessoensis TaxID=6573 RepID=A0A210QRF0_MIZYE|nr:proprotein convertase subtilisin/kexin type 5-like isoform X1 [Mizuhopecten yessoensis]OWF51327.1 Proprotein convertase subtilisin/kexin type 5 [Mizuhopecten yessoensis]
MATKVLILIVCVSVHAFIQIGAVVSTESLLFDYNGSTLAECQDHFQLEFSPNCTKVCPPFAPFRFHNLCLGVCPRGLTANSYSTCSSSYYELPSVERDKVPNLKCKKGMCSSERPFCYDYQCLFRCPANTLNEEFSCVHTCSMSFPLILNDSCVMECPKDKPYNEHGRCVTFCSNRLSKHDGTCVKNCSDNSNIYNNTCFDKCPLVAPFSFHVWNTTFCLKACPAFTVVRGDNCDVGCPRGLDFLWNQTCVQECPETDPFIYVLTERLPSHKIPVCLPTCPDDTFIDGNTCVRKCAPQMYIFNGSCVMSCPNSHPLHAYRMKFDPFNFSFVTYATHCVESCYNWNESSSSYQRMYLFNGTCVPYCPRGHYGVNNTCVDECPILYMFLHEGFCLSKCPDGLFGVNGSCLRKCPSGLFKHNNTCIDHCPASHSLLSDGNCVNLCPRYYDIYNATCVLTCPENAKYKLNGTCYTKCPSTHPYSDYYNCVKHCSHVFPFLYNLDQTCVQKCPKYFAFDRNAQSCVAKCPSSHQYNTSASAYRDAYNYECVSNCDKTQVTYQYKCMRDCPEGTSRFKTECLTQCPDSDPFTYKKEDQSGSFNYECVRECPGNTFIWRKHCFDQCPEDLTSFWRNRSCLNTCPEKGMYRAQFTTNKKHIAFRCVHKCTDFQYIDEDRCVSSCPSSRPYSFSRICRDKCPNTDRFIENYTGRCLNRCSDSSVIHNTTCYYRCPESVPFLANKYCRKSCPESLKFTTQKNEGQVCADHCLDPFIRFNTSCVEKCPAGTIIINNTCIDGRYCPTEYKYELTSPQGTVCYKRCPKGTFGDEKKCSYTCSGKKLQLESEHTCVTRCPDTHPLRDNSTEAKCVQSCREGLLEWTENKMCIASEKCDTKQAFYNYNNEKCVRNCPGISFPSFQGKECVLITKDYLIPVVVLLIIGTGSLLFLCIFCCRKSQRHHIENKNDIERSEENPPQFDDGYSSEETVLKSNEDNSSGSADNMQRLSLQQSHSSVIIPLRNMQTEELIDDSSKERQPISTSYSTDTDETCVKFV